MSSPAGGREIVSPRSATLPQAFTLHEFLDGAAWAFFAFQAIGIPLALVTGAVAFEMRNPTSPVIADLSYGLLVMVFGGIFGFPTSVAALFVGTPIAYLLGRTLRRVRAGWVHVVAFGAYGLVVGIAAITSVSSILPGLGSDNASSWAPFGGVWFYSPFTFAAAAAVAIGRWGAIRAAHATDIRVVAQPTVPEAGL